MTKRVRRQANNIDNSSYDFYFLSEFPSTTAMILPRSIFR